MRKSHDSSSFLPKGRHTRDRKLCTWTAGSYGRRRRGVHSGQASNEEILAHLDRHSKSVMKDFYLSSRRLKEDQMCRQIVNGSKVMPPYGDDLQLTDLADLIT